jgi:hypothetical protein
MIRCNDATRSPDELYPENGKPDVLALARIGAWCTGWHVKSVGDLQTDAGWWVFVRQLITLVGKDHEVWKSVDPTQINHDDMFLAFCWSFHTCAAARVKPARPALCSSDEGLRRWACACARRAVRRSLMDMVICCADRAGGGTSLRFNTPEACALASTCEFFVSAAILGADVHVLECPRHWTGANQVRAATAACCVRACRTRCARHAHATARGMNEGSER